MASANRMTGSGRGVVIPHWVRISLTRKQFAQACLMKSCSNGLPFRRSLFPSKVTSPVWLFVSKVKIPFGPMRIWSIFPFPGLKSCTTKFPSGRLSKIAPNAFPQTASLSAPIARVTPVVPLCSRYFIAKRNVAPITKAPTMPRAAMVSSRFPQTNVPVDMTIRKKNSAANRVACIFPVLDPALLLPISRSLPKGKQPYSSGFHEKYMPGGRRERLFINNNRLLKKGGRRASNFLAKKGNDNRTVPKIVNLPDDLGLHRITSWQKWSPDRG